MLNLLLYLLSGPWYSFYRVHPVISGLPYCSLMSPWSCLHMMILYRWFRWFWWSRRQPPSKNGLGLEIDGVDSSPARLPSFAFIRVVVTFTTKLRMEYHWTCKLPRESLSAIPILSWRWNTQTGRCHREKSLKGPNVACPNMASQLCALYISLGLEKPYIY